MKKESEKPSSDVLLLHSPTEDNAGVRVIRAREDSVETGELRPIKEGVPLVAGEVVRLHPREESPLLWNVEVQHEVAPAPARNGPARVTSRAYRRNWDTVFGPPKTSKAPDDEPVLN